MKAIIQWIRRAVMDNITGRMDGYIKEILKMTLETAMGNFSINKI
jgi:hypothetical protein